MPFRIGYASGDGRWSSSSLPSLPSVRGPCAQRPQPEALTVTQWRVARRLITQLQTAANSWKRMRTDAISLTLTLAAGMWPSATSSSTRVAATSVRSELEMALGASSRAMPSGLLPLTLGPLLVGGQST